MQRLLDWASLDYQSFRFKQQIIQIFHTSINLWANFTFTDSNLDSLKFNWLNRLQIDVFIVEIKEKHKKDDIWEYPKLRKRNFVAGDNN